MKIRIISPFIVLICLVLFVGMACGTYSTVPPTNPVEMPTHKINPTLTQLPPNELPTQFLPTETQYPDFFTETFRGDLSLWPYDVTNGDESKFSESQTENGLQVQLDDPDLYVYYYYAPVTYRDVRLDLANTNLGHNSNNINLVCRNSSKGRYEFTVQNDGLYQIWAYDGTSGNFDMLADGGSTAIRIGAQKNEITVFCIGNTLTLFINGSQVRQITDDHYFFTEGQVGFGVNISPSNPVTPVIVEFESLTISQP